MKPEPLKIETRGRKVRAWTLALAVAAAMTIAVRGSAATLYVSQTSTNPSPPYATLDTAAHTIQDAVDAASDGDTVLVSPDKYGLTNQVTITKGITLRSMTGIALGGTTGIALGGTTGASQTTLSGLGNNWCLWISNSAAVVDGFTLTNVFSSDPHGGIFLVGGTVQNCNFTNYTLQRQGFAMTMTGGVLSNSVVTYTGLGQGGGGESALYCSGGGLITDCQILVKQNGHPDTGVYIVGGQLRNSLILGQHGGSVNDVAAVTALSSTIADCTIANNYNAGQGGGAYMDGCLMERCIVAGNNCGGGVPGSGGGGIFETNSIIRDSLIVSNTASIFAPETPLGGLGGGVYMQGGALVNCTLSENRAVNLPLQPGQGAGVYVESGGITNCIIYSNFFLASTNSENEWFNAGPGVFDHCCTTPDPGGVGNIIQEPQFLDPTNGNFHLASTSPCIAAGVVQPWMTGAFDLDGKPRTANGVVDVGAYQSPFATPPPPPIANFSANPASGYAPLTVQFTDETTGAVTSWNWEFGDGSADSPAQNPSHTYTNAGDYIVTLTVTGSGGSDSTRQLIHVIQVITQTPQQQIASLVSEVRTLIRQGALNRGQGIMLLARLRDAENSLNEGHGSTACYEVSLFIKQVLADVRRGTLTQTEGQSLIEAAVNLRVALGCLSL